MAARPITGSAGQPGAGQPGAGQQSAAAQRGTAGVMNGNVAAGQNSMVGGQMRPAVQPSGVAQQRAPYKYNTNVRNPQPGAQAGPPQPGVPQQVPSQAVVVQGQEPLTASMLAAAQPQEQKQMLGERLFPLIQSMYPDLAGKITGMLLEIDNSELLHMLESRESLKAKVEEAVAVLQAHQAKLPPGANPAAPTSAAPTATANAAPVPATGAGKE